MDLSCRCGMRFRSLVAEARHRHNFPALCRQPRQMYRCTGCGHKTSNVDRDLYRIQRKGGLSCCPERNMVKVAKKPSKARKVCSRCRAEMIKTLNHPPGNRATHGIFSIEHKMPSGEEMREETKRRIDAGEPLGAMHVSDFHPGMFINGSISRFEEYATLMTWPEPYARTFVMGGDLLHHDQHFTGEKAKRK